MTVPKIAVFGAGGHTGRFVVQELRRRGVVAEPATRSGRFEPIGGAAEHCATIDVGRPDTLDRALAGTDAVINCAGPFFDGAEPVVGAALRAGIPYLDVTAEQVTALRLFEGMDEPAKAAGITIVPAMAFYGGLADLLVTAIAPHGADTVEIAVGLDSWHPTAGTRLTGERNTFPRQIVRNGRLVPVPFVSPTESWAFPAPIGEQPVTYIALSEIILISRHLDVSSVTSFMNLKPLGDLDGAASPRAADASGRSSQRFVVDVRATTDGVESRATASGRDIYAVTAPLIVSACLTLLAQDAPLAGVRAPGELFKPGAFLRALAPDIDVRFY